MKLIADPRPALDVRDLELVIALAESGSTVRAAGRLHLTQSAISRGLLAVEDKLGLRLFDRGAHGLAPTAAGARLIGGAGGVLARLIELEQQTRAGAGARQSIRLVCECYTAYRWLPSTMTRLRQALPALDIALAFEHTAAPVAGLLDAAVDVALLTTSRVGAPLLEQPLFSDEIVFVVAAGHPLADRPAIGRDDLRRHRLITSTNTPEPERRWFYRRVFGAQPPRVEHLSLPITEAIIDAARAGLGIAVMSEWIASPYVTAGDLVAKRLRGRRLDRPWRIAYRREALAGARQLAAALAGAAPRLFAAP